MVYRDTIKWSFRNYALIRTSIKGRHVTLYAAQGSVNPAIIAMYVAPLLTSLLWTIYSGLMNNPTKGLICNLQIK